MVAQIPPAHIPASVTSRYHLDLATLDLATEDLLIRWRRIAVSRPLPRDAERLAGIAARLEREAR